MTMRSRFIKRNPLIDFYAYLEGEEAFSASGGSRHLRPVLDREKMKSTPIDGFIHRISDTEVMKGAMLTRRRDLDEIPSPYLTGHMDKFFDGKLSPMMETNRGCPFSCTFCHEGNQLISKVNHFSIERVKAELDYIAAAVQRAPILISNLMFADPNFAMYERDYEIVEHIERIQQKQNWPRSIFASTGKNKKERIAKALRKLNGSMSMWMSVQSMDPVVLQEIQREQYQHFADVGSGERVSGTRPARPSRNLSWVCLVIPMNGTSTRSPQVCRCRNRRHRDLLVHVAERHRTQHTLQPGDP